MIGGVDADARCVVGELADRRRAPDGAVLHDIGVVAHLHFIEAASIGDFRVAAKGRIDDPGGLVDEGLKPELLRHAATFLR